MSAAATRTSNPLLLILLIGVAAFVVSERRTDAPWALGFKTYLYLGVFIIFMRVVFRAIFDSQYGEHILFTLPEIPLPEATAGIRIGGPVSAEGLLAAFYDGLRLAALVICLGAANVLANPKRLLKIIPSALYEIGVAVTVALTMAPQLVASGQRIHAARKLRGSVGKRTKWFKAVIVPVITDALDNSLLLASAMDSRGYGRRVGLSRRSRFATSGLLIAGMLGICVGLYGFLSSGGAISNSAQSTGGVSSSRGTGIGSLLLNNAIPTIFIGIALSMIGFMWSGKRVQRTRYRPDPWSAVEWGVAASGIVVAIGLFVIAVSDATAINPVASTLRWPDLPIPAVIVISIGLLPAWITPPQKSAASEMAAFTIPTRRSLRAEQHPPRLARNVEDPPPANTVVRP